MAKRFITHIQVETDQHITEEEMNKIVHQINGYTNAHVFHFITSREEFETKTIWQRPNTQETGYGTYGRFESKPQLKESSLDELQNRNSNKRGKYGR